MKKKSVLMMAMVMSLIMLMAVPALASKTGGGGEGYNSCPAEPELQFKPPVYSGWLYFKWVGGELFFWGDIEQGGNRGCSCSFPEAFPWLYGTIAESEFENLTPQGLVGICENIGGTYNDGNGVYCSCPDEYLVQDYFEISTVNRLRKVGDYWYGYVEIMRMKTKK